MGFGMAGLAKGLGTGMVREGEKMFEERKMGLEEARLMRLEKFRGKQASGVEANRQEFESEQNRLNRENDSAMNERRVAGSEKVAGIAVKGSRDNLGATIEHQASESNLGREQQANILGSEQRYTALMVDKNFANDMKKLGFTSEKELSMHRSSLNAAKENLNTKITADQQQTSLKEHNANYRTWLDLTSRESVARMAAYTANGKQEYDGTTFKSFQVGYRKGTEGAGGVPLMMPGFVHDKSHTSWVEAAPGVFVPYSKVQSFINKFEGGPTFIDDYKQASIDLIDALQNTKEGEHSLAGQYAKKAFKADWGISKPVEYYYAQYPRMQGGQRSLFSSTSISSSFPDGMPPVPPVPAMGQ